MAGYARTMTMADFRRMDLLSGEVHVVGGSRRRRGVRRQGRRASCKSPAVLAGADAACGAAAGGSAHTSAAHAASRETDAEPGKPKAGKAERAPEKKKGKKARKNSRGQAPKVRNAKGNSKKKEEPKSQTRDEFAAKSGKDKGGYKKKQENKARTGDGGGDKPKPIESLWDERVHLDGGEDLPADGGGFVDAVNEFVDLVRLTDSLLRERDERSSKSLLEKLLEMKYGKGTKTEAGGVRPIICDLPGPVRD